MSTITINWAALSPRERLTLIDERFSSMAGKVYAGNITKKEEAIHRLLFCLILWYNERGIDLNPWLES
jgi:hypothetical protein